MLSNIATVKILKTHTLEVTILTRFWTCETPKLVLLIVFMPSAASSAGPPHQLRMAVAASPPLHLAQVYRFTVCRHKPLYEPIQKSSRDNPTSREKCKQTHPVMLFDPRNYLRPSWNYSARPAHRAPLRDSAEKHRLRGSDRLKYHAMSLSEVRERGVICVRSERVLLISVSSTTWDPWPVRRVLSKEGVFRVTTLMGLVGTTTSTQYVLLCISRFPLCTSTALLISNRFFHTGVWRCRYICGQLLEKMLAAKRKAERFTECWKFTGSNS